MKNKIVQKAMMAVLIAMGSARAGELAVVSTRPGLNAGNVPTLAPISVTFDRAVKRSSVGPECFHAYGRSTGLMRGTYSFSDEDKTVTLTPDSPVFAGEAVTVILSNKLKGADGSRLRSAGYSFRFGARARRAAMDFAQVQVLSTGEPGTTRIYGAAASDLNRDGWIDLTTVNEVSADLRVFLNLGDGTGAYGPMLEPPLPIGYESSPNEAADFNRDGNIDLAVASADDDEVWIALGRGDGTYMDPAQSIDVGDEPHGIVALDVDGDGWLDVINANRASNELSLMLNDGNGVFGPASFFDGGVNGEYGLDTGDMNEDGLMDLVVAGRDGQHLRSLLNNGDGTFTPTPLQDTGGATWVVALGDVNGDGHLDASTANSVFGNGAILLGNGDGTFGAPVTRSIGAHTVSTDLGDLDGDGDLDWVLSSFGGGLWRLYSNDGNGNFMFERDFQARANPSCSIILDIDNDRDLDLALTDEIQDTVMIQKNGDRALPGDFDDDGDVDLDDHATMAGCMNGPGIDAGLPCGAGDFNGDGDLDFADASAFQNTFRSD